MALMTPTELAASNLAMVYDTDLPGVESATYTAPTPGAEAVACTARFRRGEVDEQDGSDALDVTALVLVRVSEISAVAVGGLFSVDSESWEVMHAHKSKTGLQWEARCSKR